MAFMQDKWRQETYQTRHYGYFRDLPENHILRAKNVDFKFDEYKTNLQLPCLIYQRVLTHCYNNFGVRGSKLNSNCVNIEGHFKRCIHIHDFFHKMKILSPEAFVQNEYSRDRPTLEEIGF